MKPSLVVAALSVVALVVGGALAEEPPPVVAPTPTSPTTPTSAPAPTGEAAAAKPEGAPGEAAAPGEAKPAADAQPTGGADPNAPDASGVTPAMADCEAAMPQVLAELDYWRERAAQLAAASPLRAGVPPVVAPAPTATQPPTPTPATPAGLALGPGSAAPTGVDRPRIDQVAAAVKEMKPKDAAAVFTSWDDALAIAVFEQLSGRAVSAIATALPPDHAARLLAKLSLAPRNTP